MLLVVASGGLLCLWQAWCEFPVHSWNEARLAPAFALRNGTNPYPLLGDGPLSTWIYGPGGILINLPATFAASALGALQIACLINIAVLIVPLAWVFFRCHDLQARGRLLPWLALALAVLLIPRNELLFQVADHTAIAFGIISCWFLVRATYPTALDLSLAAGSMVVAVFSKQTEIFLIAGQMVYLLLTIDRSVALRYILRVLIFGLLTLGVVTWYFGWSNLWLNLVVIPGRLPWTDDIAGRVAKRSWALFAQVLAPCVGLSWLRFTRHWPRQNNQGARMFLITIFAYLAVLPMGFVALVKIGGDINSIHSWSYLLPGCLLGVLASEIISLRAQTHWVLILSALCLCLRREDIFSQPTGPLTAHFATANELIAADRHRLWFPRNPVINYYADKKLWHSEDGVETRFLASFGLREVDFRRHLPPDLQAVIYPAKMETPFALQLLREFSEKTYVPYWVVYRRAKVGP